MIYKEGVDGFVSFPQSVRVPTADTLFLEGGVECDGLLVYSAFLNLMNV